MVRLLLLGFLLTSVSSNPVVDGPLGKITGKIQNVLDVEIESFLGIPYAKPPVGDLRFALPQPFGAVADLEATEYSSPCPQPGLEGNGSAKWHFQEDCLYLNVLRKKGTVKQDRKAVVALVHGGAFVVGSAHDSYMNAASLVAEGDVILVSFNYRLGIFGFADFKELAPANLGLHDQRLALQWIQDHITEFGGDPDRVTAIGVSAGSMSLSAHIITPIDDKNLFQSAVLDAGVIAGFYEDSESSFTRAKKIAEKLGCPTASSEMVDCLRKAKVEDLLPLSLSTTGNNGLEFFIPTLDDKFLPRNVEEYVERNAAKLRKVRTIIGYAKDEGTSFVGVSLFTRTVFPNPQTSDEIVKYMERVSSSYNHPLDYNDAQIRNAITELYVDENPGNSFRAVAELQSDAVFKCPVNNFIESFAPHNDKVYVYQFDRKFRTAYFWGLKPDLVGAFHGSPYIHFVGSLLVGTVPVDPEDKLYALDTIKTISDFAKTDEAPKFRGTEWPTFSEAEKVLIFDETPFLRKGFSNDRKCHKLFPVSGSTGPKQSKSEL